MMKIGRLVYDKKQSTMGKQVFANYGDNIQTLALDEIVYSIFQKKDVVDINIYDLPYYANESGEKILLPLCCNMFTVDSGYFLPASDLIIPLFLSVSFQVKPVSDFAIEYLKKNEPIGCRDFATYNMMTELGIKAYISGCVTFTLKKREEALSLECAKSGKVFLVNVPESAISRIPMHLIEKSEIVEQIHIYENDIEGSAANTDLKAIEIYNRYKNEAKLVITSKLHCAQPCIAMGIPVIVVREKMSCRFDLLDKLSHVYLPDEFDSIDWNPKAIDIEDLKERIRSIVSERIKSRYSFESDLEWIKSFWNNCTIHNDVTIENQIVDAIKKSGASKWILWGATGYMASYFLRIVSEKCKEVSLCAVVDEKKECVVRGISSVKSSEIESFDNTFVLVSTTSGSDYASSFLKHKGLKPQKDFLVMSMLN